MLRRMRSTPCARITPSLPDKIMKKNPVLSLQDGVFYVIIYISSLFYSLYYCYKIVICQNHITCIFCNICSDLFPLLSLYLHFLKQVHHLLRSPVIATTFPLTLKCFYNPYLVFWRNSCKYGIIHNFFF